MFSFRAVIRQFGLVTVWLMLSIGCGGSGAQTQIPRPAGPLGGSQYEWSMVTEHGAFPVGYNYPGSFRADAFGYLAKITDSLPARSGGTPIVFDEKLWLVGANRDGAFGRSSLVTSDGVSWTEEPAPWTPRGAVAVWVMNDTLYMTGGKYSVTENGEIRFIYSNDVWMMRRK
jgi:hypothetical protein